MIRFLFLFLFASFLSANYLDGVVAVVGDKVILKSDVLDQTYMLANQKNISFSNPRFEVLFESVLQEKIHRLIVLSSAEKDTSVVVSYSEINSELNNRVDYFLESFGSEVALEEAMGMKVGDIKEEYWETIKEELMVDRFRYSLFGGVDVSSSEVFSFYSLYRDSLPLSPSLFNFSVLEVPVLMSVKSKDSLFVLANNVRDSLVLGLLDFNIAVQKYSKDPGSVKSGGDLGFSKRGTFLPEYEKAAFGLNNGEYSSIVETRFGYHIIFLKERLGEKIHSKHILFSLVPSKQDGLNAKKEIESFSLFVENDPGLMDSLALDLFSNYKNSSGVFYNIQKEDIPLSVLSVVSEAAPFSFSDVFYNNNSYFLCYKGLFVAEEQTTLQNNWPLVESLALNKKMSDLFALWIEKQIPFIYVKVYDY